MVKRGLILGGVLAIISLASFSYVYADTTGSTKFSVDVENTVLELTIPATPAVIDLNPTMTGASFGSTSINVKVATNNITGYQLTMTPTNSQTNTSLIRTELVGTEQTYREIETLEQTDPVSTGYPEADFTANKWGYKITGDNYYGIDPNNTTVSHPAWATNEPTNGTNHNLTLAAKVDAETVSGAYETTLNFRAVTNAVVAKDTVTFNGNGADGGDMSGDTMVAPYGTSIILPANKYSKSGYHFIGWNTNTSGTGLSYVDEGEYNPVSSDYSHNITLYAMWSNLPEGASTSGTTPSGNPGVTISRAYEIAYTAAHKGMWEKDAEGNGYTQISDGVYHGRDVRWDMQGMTPDICNSVTAMHDDYQALDIRDFKLYHITKLRDGQCWMTQDLDFNITTDALSSNDTDLVQYNVGGYTASNGYSKNGDTIVWTPASATVDGASDFRSTYDILSYDLGNWYSSGLDAGDVNYDYINGSTGGIFRENEPYENNGEHGHVGVYYNVAAATAMNNSSYYARYENGTLNDMSKNPQNSVCPKGWRLPIVSNYAINDYGTLIATYGINRVDGYGISPFYFIRSGTISYAGHVDTRYGKYGISTVAEVHYLSGLRFYQFTFGSSGHSDAYPYYGYSFGTPIRCIAR